MCCWAASSLLWCAGLLALTPTSHFSCCTTGAATATLPALHHPGFPQNRLGFPWHARMGQATIGYVPAIARDVHWRLRPCWNLTRRGAGSRSPPFSQPSIFPRQLSDPPTSTAMAKTHSVNRSGRRLHRHRRHRNMGAGSRPSKLK